MAWEIVVEDRYFQYSYKDEEHVGAVSYVSRDIWEEKAEYKAPNDSVMKDVYQFHSAHGVFEWEVIARHIGYDEHINIEANELTKIPVGCEILSEPSFSTRDNTSYDYLDE